VQKTSFNKKQLVKAVIIGLIFGVGPILLIDFLSEEFIASLSSQGISVNDILTQVAILGFLQSILLFIKSYFWSNQKVMFALSVLSRLYFLFITVQVLSLGDFNRYGYGRIVSEAGGIINSVTLDLRFFVYIMIFVTLLDIISSFFDMKENQIIHNN
jgi:hypothetical protein